MTTLIAEQPRLDTDLIHVHPRNARHEAIADDEMVDSIRSGGIAQALTVMPYIDGDCPLHEACFTLGAGHRRLDGARKAGLTQVPVMLREDLVTDAQQLEFMAIENLHRVDLTSVEEGELYEQLTLHGMSPEDIAKATGRKASTIKSRLKLNTLTDAARDRLHAGDMTLLDAEALLEFADDAAATATLEAAIGTTNFRYEVESARRARKRAAERAGQVAELQALGAVEVDEVRDGTQRPLSWLHEDLREPTAHAGCLGYVVPTSSWQDPFLICTDPERHPKPATPGPAAPVESEWEKARAQREARRERHDAAAAVRLSWLVEHFSAMFPAKSHTALGKAMSAWLPVAVLDDREAVSDTTLLAALGALPEDRAHPALTAAKESYAADLTTAKPTKVLTVFGEWLAANVAEQLAQDLDWVTDPTAVLLQLQLWDWLKTAGYPLSDVDKEIRTALEVKHTELAEAEAS